MNHESIYGYSLWLIILRKIFSRLNSRAPKPFYNNRDFSLSPQIVDKRSNYIIILAK
jgi:hypothetical protein